MYKRGYDVMSEIYSGSEGG